MAMSNGLQTIHVPGVVPPPTAPTPTVLNPDDNYCLRWNDYEKKYAETFRKVIPQI